MIDFSSGVYAHIRPEVDAYLLETHGDGFLSRSAAEQRQLREDIVLELGYAFFCGRINAASPAAEGHRGRSKKAAEKSGEDSPEE